MRNAPDKLTSTHHTKHIPKQQQTNKNDADWALAWWRCEQARMESAGRQGARLAGKLLSNKPAALFVPISLAALATMCCNCGTSSLPQETVSWGKGCILSICLYHSAQTELKPNLMSKLIHPHAWLGCNEQSPGPIIPNTFRCLVHLVLFFLISHSSSPGLCFPILSFYPPKATPILTLRSPGKSDLCQTEKQPSQRSTRKLASRALQRMSEYCIAREKRNPTRLQCKNRSVLNTALRVTGSKPLLLLTPVSQESGCTVLE